MANDTYDYLKVSDGTGDAALMHITTPRIIGATVIQVDTVVGVPAFFIATYGTLLSNGFIDPTTKRDFYGHTSAGTLVIDGFCSGSADSANTAGQVVVIKPNTQWANDMVALAQKEHHNDGTHAAVTADSLLVAGQDVTVQNLYRNGIINGGCLVAQRAVPNISTTYQYGAVDRFAAKASGTAVSAGTIAQNLSSLLSTSLGAEIKLAGVTVTGAGIVYLRYRMEAKDAAYFKNTAASFQCNVYQDTGSTIGATIFIRKATVVDNFTGVTDIANSGSINVLTATKTTIKFENINAGSLGDVSNGLEIEIQLACGAVTTKNFSFSEFCLIKSAKAASFAPRMIEHELAACQRYYEKSYDLATPTATATGVGEVTLPSNTNGAGVETTATIAFATRKRATPAIGFWDGSGNASKFNTNIAVTGGGFSATTSFLQVDALAPGITRYIFHWAVDAEL